jgi:hypothetical protein
MRGAVRGLVVSVSLVLAACQPFGGPGAVVPTSTAPAGRPAIGAPPAGMPGSLAELLSRAETRAREWQDEPVVAEIEVDLDAQHRWLSARVVFLAADADRFLTLEAEGAGFTEQRPTLSTLQVVAVTAEGIAEMPAFPGDAAEPAVLAQSPAGDECGLAPERTVLYVTGAPVAWDGTAWSTPPQWSATIGAGDAAAAVDLRTGDLVRCLE